MQTFLIAAVFVCAVLAIVGRYRSPAMHYVYKPLTTLLIIAVAGFAGMGNEPGSYRWLVLAGLLFSLVGDVFLMLPKDRFIAGLASFLLAHLFYIAAFGLHGGTDAPLWLWVVVALGALASIASLLPNAGKLRIPVACYSLVIAAMALTALARGMNVDTPAANLAASGALLFVASDSLLGFNRFVKPFAAAEALLLSSYFCGQLLIALSV